MSSMSSNTDCRLQPEIHKHLLMAATSSAFAELLTFPIDTIKVYLQLQGKPHGEIHHLPHEVGSWFTGMKSGHSHHLEKLGVYNLYDTVHEIYDVHGLNGYYRGATPAILRASLNNALSATIYKPVRQYLGAETRDCSLYVKLAAGFLTGAGTQILASPTDLLKVRMQADAVRTKPRYHGVKDAISQIYHKGGIKVFWKGIMPSMGRAGFSVAATLGTYDHCKASVLRHSIFGYHAHEKDTRLHIICALCSGLCATLLACPFDVVKTRYQSQSLINPIYSSSRECLKLTVKEQGIFKLWSGFIPMYSRLGPWQIAFFVMFECLHIKILGKSF